MSASIPWRLSALNDGSLPSASRRSLPEPGGTCELCDRPDPVPLGTVLVVDGPDGLPVPFLICTNCRRALDELHALLESAAASAPERTSHGESAPERASHGESAPE